MLCSAIGYHGNENGKEGRANGVRRLFKRDKGSLSSFYSTALTLSDVDRRGSRREGIGKGRGEESPCKIRGGRGDPLHWAPKPLTTIVY